jgi:hypothetical protein
VRRNLEGARDRLASGVDGTITGVEVDVTGLLAAIDARLAGDGDLTSPLTITWRKR